jgi:formylglycine-generating enzyme required for sulfatase activity
MVSLLFVLTLMGCDQSAKSVPGSAAGISVQKRDEFVQGIKKNLVFVEGGEFLMGDYGEKYGPEGLPYDADQDSKPLHKVQLSSYSIEKFKVTNQEYQFYLQDNGLQLRAMGKGNQKNWKDISAAPNTPAHMDWYEAEQYCNWLAQVAGVPFYLPTEAQWEYAARSRGQFLMVATDDGSYKATNVPNTEYDGPRGINISSSMDREDFAKKMGWKTGTLTPLPVDRFPSNPLGLYSMSDNGEEWVKDWYDPDYYQHSPMTDPQGPEKPVFKDYFGRDVKVVRGQGFANPAWGGG